MSDPKAWIAASANAEQKHTRIRALTRAMYPSNEEFNSVWIRGIDSDDDSPVIAPGDVHNEGKNELVAPAALSTEAPRPKIGDPGIENQADLDIVNAVKTRREMLHQHLMALGPEEIANRLRGSGNGEASYFGSGLQTGISQDSRQGASEVDSGPSTPSTLPLSGSRKRGMKGIAQKVRKKAKKDHGDQGYKPDLDDFLDDDDDMSPKKKRPSSGRGKSRGRRSAKSIQAGDGACDYDSSVEDNEHEPENHLTNMNFNHGRDQVQGYNDGAEHYINETNNDDDATSSNAEHSGNQSTSDLDRRYPLDPLEEAEPEVRYANKEESEGKKFLGRIIMMNNLYESSTEDLNAEPSWEDESSSGGDSDATERLPSPTTYLPAPRFRKPGQGVYLDYDHQPRRETSYLRLDIAGIERRLAELAVEDEDADDYVVAEEWPFYLARMQQHLFKEEYRLANTREWQEGMFDEVPTSKRIRTFRDAYYELFDEEDVKEEKARATVDVAVAAAPAAVANHEGSDEDEPELEPEPLDANWVAERRKDDAWREAQRLEAEQRSEKNAFSNYFHVARSMIFDRLLVKQQCGSYGTDMPKVQQKRLMGLPVASPRGLVDKFLRKF
ncbi:hypothetical protein F4778DRAFT_790530 [Xylariomycetidae sp. FL2044]|nr:hypothetical protein F4778DRAFT_790530 [Xylariomycetidae sp. FL2044]